jgi:hypothetical protein
MAMQLIPQYKKQLKDTFLKWYLKEFATSRMSYIHWSAAYRNQNWPEYHIVITEDDGKVSVHHNASVLEDMYNHTYKRNSNSFAVCVGSMYKATTNNFGAEAPTPSQLKALVLELSAVCVKYKIPVGNILSHAEAADNLDGRTDLECYGPKHGCERWDFWVEIDPLTLKLYPHREEAFMKDLQFMDWLRGEIILRIQKATEAKWKK